MRSDKKILILVVTTRCNLRCTHCQVEKKNTNMNLETARKAVSLFLEKNDSSQRSLIRFFGGEPLLNFDVVKKVVDRTRRRYANVDFDIATNGLLLDRGKAEFFQKRPNLKLIVSSMRKEIFNTRLFLDVFTRLPSLSVTINMLPGKTDSAKDIFADLCEKGVRRFKFLPSYYVKWSSKEIRSLRKCFDEIRKAIASAKTKIRLENMDQKNQVPLHSSAPTVDCNGDVYSGNYFLDRHIRKYGNMLKLGNVHNLANWRAVSDFPLNTDPDYILKRIFPEEILRITMEVDRALTEFLINVEKK
jgi:organic radical activating enzyme